VPTQRILDDLFEGLTRIDGSGAVVPGVASSWDRSADGLTWIFHLRADARWSNGDAVTARDFLFGWRRTVDPATAAEYAQQFAPLRNGLDVAAGRKPVEALGVQMLDAHTLRVELESPTPYFLYLLTNNYFAPLHEATLHAKGADWTRAGNMVSNGAFMLKDLVINGSVSLVKNPHYWDAAAVRLDAVTYYPLPDRGAVTARFLAGDVDYTDGFNIDDIDWLRRDLGEQVRLSPYFGIVMLGMHTRRPPFDSLPVRQALSMAIDREILVNKLLRGLFLPAYDYVPPYEGYKPAVPDWATWSADQRHARGRELLAQAGYTAAHPLHIELAHQITSPDSRRMLEAIAAMWRMNLGVEVTLSTSEWRVFMQDRRLGKHGLFWHAWIGDYPDPYTFLSLFSKEDGNNHPRYANDRFESLLVQGVGSTDDARRLQLFRDAEAQLNADAPSIPVYYYQSRHLVRPYVQGWKGNVMDRNPSRNLWLAAGGG
jgi:oligopeptide transport system substrate-binding protein